MAKKKVVDIDAEFDGVDFDEAEIKKATGIAKRSQNPDWHLNRTAAVREAMKTEQWKNNVLTATEIRKNDPNWLEKNKTANQEKWKNVKTKEKHLASVRARTEDPAWLDKVTKNNKAKVNDVEHRKRHQKAIDNRGQGDWYEKNARKNTLLKSKPVVTPYGIFPSRIVAVKTSGVTNIGGKINKYVKVPDSGYYYITQEEYTKLTGKTI